MTTLRPSCAECLVIRSLNRPEPSGPHRPVIGVAFLRRGDIRLVIQQPIINCIRHISSVNLLSGDKRWQPRSSHYHNVIRRSLVQTADIQTNYEGYRGFPKSLSVNAVTVFQNRPQSLPSTASLFHYSLFTTTC